MTIKILQTITDFKLLTDDEFFKTNNFVLSSNQDLKRDNFSHPFFEKAIGAMRYNMVHSHFNYACTLQESAPEFVPTDMTEILMKEMEKLNQFVNGLASFLWFVKDNSVNPTEIYGQVSHGGEYSFLSMSPVSHISNCHAAQKEVSFTKDEIDTAYALSRKYILICPQNEDEFRDRIQPEAYSGNLNNRFKKAENENINYNTYNRIERGIKFLQIARETHYLPRKISMYMPIFECLFCIEAEGVSHKVSERVAFYLGGDKKGIFKDFKDAYNIRSRYLHGDEIKKDQTGRDYQIELAEKIDNLTRLVLTKIITEDANKFLQKKDDFRTYLDNIIFQ